MLIDNNILVEQIEAYLSGSMSVEDKAAFEVMMANDKKLRNKVRLHQLIVAAIQDHGRREDNELSKAMHGISRDEMQQLLSKRRNERLDIAACVPNEDNPLSISANVAASASASSDNTSVKKSGFWKYLLSAAALIGGVWFGAKTFYTQKFTSLSDQKISDTYIAIKESEAQTQGVVRGDNEVFALRHSDMTEPVEASAIAPEIDSVEVVMQQALFAMRNNMSDDAIRLLEPLYEQSGYSKKVGIALAMAYVKSSQHDKAIETLTALNSRYEGDPEIENLLKVVTD